MTIDLDKLERLAKAATPGPYYAVSPQVAYDNCAKHEFCPEHGDAHEDAWTVSPSPEHAGWNTDTGMSGYGICEHDARFFAALDPATVLELVRRARMATVYETALERLPSCTDLEDVASAYDDIPAALRPGNDPRDCATLREEDRRRQWNEAAEQRRDPPPYPETK